MRKECQRKVEKREEMTRKIKSVDKQITRKTTDLKARNQNLSQLIKEIDDIKDAAAAKAKQFGVWTAALGLAGGMIRLKDFLSALSLLAPKTSFVDYVNASADEIKILKQEAKVLNQTIKKLQSAATQAATASVATPLSAITPAPPVTVFSMTTQQQPVLPAASLPTFSVQQQASTPHVLCSGTQPVGFSSGSAHLFLTEKERANALESLER